MQPSVHLALLVAIVSALVLTQAANVDNKQEVQYTADTISLSHPGVIHFPLSRSGSSSTKAAARAAAGDLAYQRLMQAMAHGARLNAREQETMGLGIAPLIGCPFADFTIPVTIGKSTFQLLVDTGSSTLAVAGASCTNCNGVSPLWAASATSTNQNKAVSGSYGDATGWAGSIYLDKVALGDGSTPSNNVTAYVSQRIAVIVQQSTTNTDASGNPKAGASNFFVTTPCVDDTKHRNQIVTQGIIGVAFQSLASSGTDSFMMSLFAQYPSLPQVFTLQMCSSTGSLWIGGYDSAKTIAPPQYTPLSAPGLYYSVSPTDMMINGKRLGFDASAWAGGVTIIDSGTTLWELPSGVYRAVVDAIIADPNFQKNFRSGANDNFFDQASANCEMATTGASALTLQQILPTITIEFANGLQLTMDGVGSYLLPCSNSYDQWTPGISSGSGGMIAGWPLMNQFTSVHDVANMKVGFSVTKGCTSGRAPLRANVTMNAASPGGNPSNPSGSGLIGTTAVFQLTFAFDPTTQNSTYQSVLLNDFATALGVDVSRLSITQIVSVSSQAQITFQLTPTTSAADVSPSQAIDKLKSQLDTPSSAIYSGTYSKTVVKSSLDVISSGNNLSGASTFSVSTSILALLSIAATLLMQRL